MQEKTAASRQGNDRERHEENVQSRANQHHCDVQKRKGAGHAQPRDKAMARRVAGFLITVGIADEVGHESNHTRVRRQSEVLEEMAFP
eukprot:2715069-Karenia_brevis.AAC.1